jgi:hypothetical protein
MRSKESPIPLANAENQSGRVLRRAASREQAVDLAVKRLTGLHEQTKANDLSGLESAPTEFTEPLILQAFKLFRIRSYRKPGRGGYHLVNTALFAAPLPWAQPARKLSSPEIVAPSHLARDARRNLA